MLDWLKDYHSNIKLTIELKPSEFLDTKRTNINGAKNKKLPSPQTSESLKGYNRNKINGDLYCPKKISLSFDEENPLIKENFIKADYPLSFIKSVVDEFEKVKEYGDRRFTNPRILLKIIKPFISIEIPYCELSATKSKHFLKKFHKFADCGFRIVIA